MLNYSFSTLLMAFLASNLIIIIIALCFCWEHILQSVGYKALMVFLILTLFRFVFPFELPFAHTVTFPYRLSTVIMLVQNHLFVINGVRVSIWEMFELIWLIGILIYLCIYIRQSVKMRRFICQRCEDITDTEPYVSLMARICGDRRNRFRILTSSQIYIPCIYGIRTPCILLPAGLHLSEEDLFYVLSHEASHHFHHDLLIKRIFRFVCMVYWWNPFCHLLRKQIELILEMHVDDSLIHGDLEKIQEYLDTLYRITDETTEKQSSSLPDAAPLLKQKTSALSYRVSMMVRKQYKPSILSTIAVIASIFLIYLSSYLITFESYTLPDLPKATTDDAVQLNVDNIYAVPKEDGTFDLYFKDCFLDNVSSLEGFLPEVPIQDTR